MIIDNFRHFTYTFLCTNNHVVHCFMQFFSTEKEVNHMKMRLESKILLEIFKANISSSAYNKLLESVKAQMKRDINVQYVLLRNFLAHASQKLSNLLQLKT